MVRCGGQGGILRYFESPSPAGFLADWTGEGRSASDPENDVQKRAGDDNEIYGNTIEGFDGHAIAFPDRSDEHGQRPEDQAVLCGNDVDGPVEGEPGSQCPSDVPEGDGVGHEGWDSPWA